MAKFAARPERYIAPTVRARNRAARRVSDVDTSHVTPLRDLPELPTDTTSQQTGEHADYTYRRHDDDWQPPEPPPPLPQPPQPPPAPAPPSIIVPPPERSAALIPDHFAPIPDAYELIARFPLLSITGAKFNGRGDMDITFRVSVDDVEKVLPLWKLRREGFFFYMDAYGLSFGDLSPDTDHAGYTPTPRPAPRPTLDTEPRGHVL